MLKKIQDSHKHSKKNTAISAPLAKLARVECADDKDPDKRDKNGRLAVECIFVITYGEKLELMKAVEKLGPMRATQVMFEAAIKEAREKSNEN
jgi:hypothetical protein